ncbi:MAG: MFS transporter [Acaryochloridaceae cyanobacterium SU_2_1]|nr:MFS transporter [Acaryochloridaceae cyanobacterium SU_2_1]
MTHVHDPKLDGPLASNPAEGSSAGITVQPPSTPVGSVGSKTQLGTQGQSLGLDKGQGFGPVLRNTNFLLMWIGQVFSQMADKVYLVLMIALITTRFQASGQSVSVWVSSIMIAFTVPAVLFGSVAGVFVDRWSKKWVLVLTNVLRGVLVLSLPALLWLSGAQIGWLHIPLGFWMLLAVTFLVSTLTQFFAPAEQSAIPLIVQKDQLLSANSLYTLTMLLAVIAGFAAGEPLLEMAAVLFAHYGWNLGREVVVGGSYAIAGLLLLLLKTGETATDRSNSDNHVWTDIKEGLRYINDHRRIQIALIQLIILFSVFAALAVLVVRMAEVLPAIKASQFGFLLAMGGIGMAISAGLLGSLGQGLPRYRLSFYGSMGMAAMLVGLSFSTHILWLTMLLLMGLGSAAALIGVPMQTTIQEKTPEEMRGKVFGLQNNATNIALSLPLALAGIAETFLGLQVVLLGLAGIVVIGGVLSWYIADTPHISL